MRADVILTINRTGANLAHLPKGLAVDGSFYPHLGGDGGAVRARANRFEDDPMIGVAVVSKEAVLYGTVIGILTAHNEVEEAIVVEIAPRRAPGVHAFLTYGFR